MIESTKAMKEFSMQLQREKPTQKLYLSFCSIFWKQQGEDSVCTM
jgi:hypothetical protein